MASAVVPADAGLDAFCVSTLVDLLRMQNFHACREDCL